MNLEPISRRIFLPVERFSTPRREKERARRLSLSILKRGDLKVKKKRGVKHVEE